MISYIGKIMSDQSALRDLISVLDSAVDGKDELTNAANPNDSFNEYINKYMQQSNDEWKGSSSNSSQEDRSRKISNINFAKSAKAINDFNQALSQGGSVAIKEFEKFSQSMGRTSEGIIRHGQKLASTARSGNNRSGLNRANNQIRIGERLQESLGAARNIHQASKGSEIGHYTAMRGAGGDFNSILTDIKSTLESAAKEQKSAAKEQSSAAKEQTNAAQATTKRPVNVPAPQAHGWTTAVKNTVDNVLASAMQPMMEQFINKPMQTGMMAAETMPGFLPSASLVDQPFKVMTGYLNRLGGDVQTLEMEKKSLLAMTGSPETSQKIVEHAVEIAKTDPVEFSTAINAFRTFSAFPGTKAEVSNDAGFRSSLVDTIQRLNILVPEQGEQGAMFAIRELLSGQEVSLKRRFNIDLKTITDAAGSPMSKGQFLGLQGGEMIKVLETGLKKITGQSAMVEKSLTTSVQVNDIQDTLMQAFALPFTKQGAGVSMMSGKEQQEYEQTLLQRNRRIFGSSLSDEEIKARSEREAEIAATSKTGAMASGMRGLNDLLGNALQQTGVGDAVSGIIKRDIVAPFLEISKGDTTTDPMTKLTTGIQKVSDGLLKASKEVSGNRDLQQLAETLTGTAVSTATKLIAPAATKGMVMGATGMADTLMSPDLLANVMRDSLSGMGGQGLMTPSAGIAMAGLGYLGTGLLGGVTKRMSGAERFEYDERAGRYQGVNKKGQVVQLGKRSQAMANMFGGDFQRGINLPMLATGAGLLMGGVTGLSSGQGGVLESIMGVGSTLAGGATLLSAIPEGMKEGYRDRITEPARRQIRSERARMAARQRSGITPTRREVWSSRARIAGATARSNALPIAGAAIGGAVLLNQWIDERSKLQEQQKEQEKRLEASSLSSTERARFMKPTGQGMMGNTLSHLGMGAMTVGGALMASGAGIPLGLGVMAVGGAASIAGGIMKGRSAEQRQRDLTSIEQIDSYERQKREAGRVWADLWTEGETSGLATTMGKPLIEPTARKEIREIDTLTIGEQMALSPKEKKAATERKIFKGEGLADTGWTRAIELERQSNLLKQGGAYSVYREKPGAEGADQYGWTTEKASGWLSAGTEVMDLRRKIATGGELSDEEKLMAVNRFASATQYKTGADAFAGEQIMKLQSGIADEGDKDWLVKNFDKLDISKKYKERKGVELGDITEGMTKGLGEYQESFRDILGNKASAKIAEVASKPGGLQEDLLKLASERTEAGTVTADYDTRKKEFMEKAEAAGVKLDSSRIDKFTESIHKMGKGLVDASGGTKSMADATKQATQATLKASTDLKDQQKAQMIELMPKFAEMSSGKFVPGGGGEGKYFGVDKNTEKIMGESFDLDATKFMSDPTGYFNRMKAVGRNIGEFVQERDQKILQTGNILGTFKDSGGRFKSDWETEGEFQFRKQSLQAQAQMGRTGATEQMQMEGDLNKYLQGLKNPDELWENIQKFGGAGFTIDPELRKKALSGMMTQGLTNDMRTGTEMMDEYRAESQKKMGKELGYEKYDITPMRYEDADTALVQLPGRGEGLHRVNLEGVNAPEITPDQQEIVSRMTGRYKKTGDLERFNKDLAELKDPLAAQIAESLTPGFGDQYFNLKDKLMTPEGLQEFAKSDQAKGMSVENKEKLTQLFHHTGLQRKAEMEKEAGVDTVFKLSGVMDETGAMTDAGKQIYRDKKTGKIRDDVNIKEQMVSEGWWEGLTDTDDVYSALPESILTDRSGRERSPLEVKHWRNWKSAIRPGSTEGGDTIPDAYSLIEEKGPKTMWSDKGESIQFDKTTGQWSNVKEQIVEDAKTKSEKTSNEQQVSDTTSELNQNMQTVNDTLSVLNDSITETVGRLNALGN